MPETAMAKADVNVQRKSEGRTALYVASQKGYTDIVKALIAAKADVNAKVHKGGQTYTALKIAEDKGNSEIVKLLREQGAK
jgi:ankyrin repeat protein